MGRRLLLYSHSPALCHICGCRGVAQGTVWGDVRRAGAQEEGDVKETRIDPTGPVPRNADRGRLREAIQTFETGQHVRDDSGGKQGYASSEGGCPRTLPLVSDNRRNESIASRSLVLLARFQGKVDSSRRGRGGSRSFRDLSRGYPVGPRPRSALRRRPLRSKRADPPDIPTHRACLQARTILKAFGAVVNRLSDPHNRPNCQRLALSTCRPRMEALRRCPSTDKPNYQEQRNGTRPAPRRDWFSSGGEQRINRLVRWRRSWLPHVSIAGRSGSTTPDTASGRRGMRSGRRGRAAIGTGGWTAAWLHPPHVFSGLRIVRPSGGASV